MKNKISKNVPPPNTEEILKFWRDEDERLTQQSKNFPHEIALAADDVKRHIETGHVADPELADFTSLNARARSLEDLRLRNDNARRKRGGEASGRTRAEKNAARNERVKTASSSGTNAKKIAVNEGISVGTVYRILK